MMYIIFSLLLFIKTTINIEEIKWCLISEAEMVKCNKIQKAMSMTNISSLFNLGCILKNSPFDCMEMIQNYKADLINLDVGLAYHATTNYGMRAFAVEKYNLENEKKLMKIKYTSNAVVVKNSVSSPKNLRGISACFSGTGTAEGWLYPLSRMIKENWLPVTTCNNIVKVASALFTNGSCAPGNKEYSFNPLGDNGESFCKHCFSIHNYRDFCSYSDAFAGNVGALNCLKNSHKSNIVSVAFLRGDVINKMILNGELQADEYELLCPNEQADGSYNAPLENVEECNWGKPQSRMIMTRLSVNNMFSYQTFLKSLVEHFGPNGTSTSYLQIFRSLTDYEISNEIKISLGQNGHTQIQQPLYDLIFSDATMDIYFPPEHEIINYFEFIDQELNDNINLLNKCPLPGVKWCVIDGDSMAKCSLMKLALETIRVYPSLHCVLGDSTPNCMTLISEGYADLMTLDAAELYIGGKYLNLVPIAIEVYGDTTEYYGVVVTKKTNDGILISNWNKVKTCHGAAGKAVGWVLPITVALHTNQLSIFNRDIVASFGQLVLRSCIPGILDDAINPDFRHPINLCEICSAGGADLCKANHVESQFTDSGAFVCLLEVGDIAFVRHYTVYDNTNGRNTVDWARNKMSDDFEIICQDGTRREIYEWKDCNIGKVTGNTVVTASFKSEQQREAMWMLLRHAKEHFSSDGNSVFSLFQSTFNRYDVLFSDGATSLKQIPLINQSYLKTLDATFMKKCETIENLSKPGYSGFYLFKNKK